MPEGQTEVERRYLKYGKKPVQMQKPTFSPAFLFRPSVHTGAPSPPGEGFVTASQLPDKFQFEIHTAKGHPGGVMSFS